MHGPSDRGRQVLASPSEGEYACASTCSGKTRVGSDQCDWGVPGRVAIPPGARVRIETGFYEGLEWLLDRGRAHFGDRLAESVLAKAATQLADDRREILQRGLCPPGGAEYLDLLAAVLGLCPDTAAQETMLDRIAEFVLQKHPFEERL